MTGKAGAAADAVWQQQPKRWRPTRRPPRSRQGQAAARSPALPDFVAPQLCKLVDRAARGRGWAHEIKFDGYRLQLRVEDGKATPAHPQGPRLDGEVPADRQGGRDAARRHHRRRGRARSTATARPTSRPCRPRCRTAKTDDLIFFAFDLLFADGEDLRALPLRERKARLQALLDAAKAQARASPLRRPFRDGRRRGAASRPAACRWKASSPSGSTRPTARAAATAGPRPSAAPATRW